ncbi:MAG: penicillin-binding protein 2 [Nitrospirae bacterium]|nr:penicillin-binding protein 2 [Candidatus Troglogloeales bacterium]MBI3598025.1 penicillin-binding protein 2 [Candidatus Troglogloeales bacterium]
MSKGPTPFSRSAQFFLVASVLTVGFLFVLIRLAVIQWLQHGKWDHLAKAQHERTIPADVERGTIYDRNGRILAINVEVPSLFAISDKIKNPAKTAKQLAPLLNVTPRSLIEKFNREKDFVWIARKIEQTRLIAVEKLQLPGIEVLMESKRFYPKRALFGHIIGFVGIDNNGLEGVEHKYDDLLKGKKGGVVVVRDAYGRSIYPKGFNYIPPSQGGDVTLTLDETIQYISARALQHGVEQSGAKAGTVLVMNPTNGAILSMAVYPPFNPNKIGLYQPSEWRNKAITDMYEPGSTFKIVTAAAALEEKLVSPEEVIDCENGVYAIAGTMIHDHTPMGKVPFYDVIAKSSNIGTIKVATRLGAEKLSEYARSFGFGTRRGIDLTGESPGLLHNVDAWSSRSLASIAIGQEIGVTALQMISAAAVIANNGVLVTPHVIDNHSIGRGDLAPTPVGEKVISDRTVKEMTAILERVVVMGTGRKAAIPGFVVAGKTGTAQKIDPVTGVYSKNGYVSSFVGFVPANKPVLSILVMIDEAAGERTGGEVAAPVFSAIGREVLRYLKIPPDSSVGVSTVTTSPSREKGA